MRCEDQSEDTVRCSLFITSFFNKYKCDALMNSRNKVLHQNKPIFSSNNDSKYGQQVRSRVCDSNWFLDLPKAFVQVRLDWIEF